MAGMKALFKRLGDLFVQDIARSAGVRGPLSPKDRRKAVMS